MRRYVIFILLLLLPGMARAQHTRAYGHGGSLIVTSDTTNIDKTNRYVYYYTTDANWYVSGGGILKEITLTSTATGTITATVAQFDTIEGLTTDSIFVNDDMVLLQDILFKGTSSNVTYWVDSSGDTVVAIDPNGNSYINAGFLAVGNTSPVAKLMVSDTTDGTPYFILTATDSNRIVNTIAEATDSAAVYAYVETDGDGYLGIRGNNGDYGSLQIDANSFNIVSTDAIELQAGGSNRMTIGTSRISSIELRPVSDDSYLLGGASNRWQDFYSSDNIYHGGKGQTATVYWSKENTIAGTDSSGELTWDGNGNPNVVYNSAVGNASWRGVESVSTTDGNATTIYTLGTSTDTDYIVEVTFVGSQDDGTNEYYAKIAFCVSNVTGTVTEDSENDIFEDDNSAGSAADASGAVSGTDYLIQVTGVAAENWNWEVSYFITSVVH